MKQIAVAVLALSLAAVALAQGPGAGEPGRKWQSWQFGANNTSGWVLMSPEERVEHRNKMMSFQTYDECRIYVEGHHKMMEARAKEQGKTVPATPRSNLCERMKQAGRLK